GGHRLAAGVLPAGAGQGMFHLGSEGAERDHGRRPQGGDDAEVGGRPAAEAAQRAAARGAAHRGAAGARPQARRSTAAAGQAPTAAYSSWLRPANAVSSRNHGLTSAARAALARTTVPASANRARSSGRRPADMSGVALMSPPGS